ncbi:MAG: NAD(+)/NADH kinase [Candidatus Zixiibacteriota bacterium]|nr:MAG: NAD(+)/NADH kinase [candidate division Zixibacteria bacterium]
MRRRQQKARQSHYCLLVNKSAPNYSRRAVERLTAQIRRRGGYFTVFEPESAAQLSQTAQKVCGLRRWHRGAPQQFSRRGKVTGLVACGGDGTFNQVARVALKANIPVGMLPMGSENNIARALCGSVDHDDAIKKIVARKYRKIDTATAAGQIFVSSAGIGFIPQLGQLLKSRGKPRFCLSWSPLASRAAASVKLRKMVVKIDAFRFEVQPIMVNVNLLPYTLTLPLSPVSAFDDHRAEVLLDFGPEASVFAPFVRQICRKKYTYGNQVKLFRGADISIEPARGALLYYDGELVEVKDNALEVKIASRQLKVFC